MVRPVPGAAPDVMRVTGKLLPGQPRAQGTWRIGGVPLPVRQCPLDGELTAAQQQHIDVAVLAERRPYRQFDRVAARDPPRDAAASENVRALARSRRFPGTPRGSYARQPSDANAAAVGG